MKIHFIIFKAEMNCPKHKNENQSGFVSGNMLFVKNSDLKLNTSNWKKFINQHYSDYKPVNPEGKAIVFSSGAVWQLDQKFSLLCLYPHNPKDFTAELHDITEYLVSYLRKIGSINLINNIGFRIYLYTPDIINHKYYLESFKTNVTVTDTKLNESREYVLKVAFDEDGILKTPDPFIFGEPKPLSYKIPETPVTSSWIWS